MSVTDVDPGPLERLHVKANARAIGCTWMEVSAKACDKPLGLGPGLLVLRLHGSDRNVKAWHWWTASPLQRKAETCREVRGRLLLEIKRDVRHVHIRGPCVYISDVRLR